MQGRRLRPGTRRAMSEADYAGLITAAHRYLNAPVIVIWDNAVEGAWSVMKNSLGNLAAGTTDQLAAAMRHQLDRI